MILRMEVVARIHLAMWFLGLWNWFGARMQKSLERKASEVLISQKQSSVSHSGGVWRTSTSREMQEAKAKLRRFQRETKTLMGIWTTGHLCRTPGKESGYVLHISLKSG